MTEQKTSNHKTNFIWFLKKPELPASLLLIIAFFLPWFTNPVLTAPGYEISKILGFFFIPQPVFGFLVLLSFLIPLGGAIIVILSILKKSVALLCMITGMFPIIILVVLYFKNHLILNQLAVGFILTGVATIILLLTGAFK